MKRSGEVEEEQRGVTPPKLNKIQKGKKNYFFAMASLKTTCKFFNDEFNAFKLVFESILLLFINF